MDKTDNGRFVACPFTGDPAEGQRQVLDLSSPVGQMTQSWSVMLALARRPLHAARAAKKDT